MHAPLQANGADIKGGTWFETGAEMLNGGTLNYFAVPFGIVNNPLPLVAVTLVEVALIGAVENYRSVALNIPMDSLPPLDRTCCVPCTLWVTQSAFQAYTDLKQIEFSRRTQSGPPGFSPGKGGGKFESDVFNGLDTLYPGGVYHPAIAHGILAHVWASTAPPKSCCQA
jgi:light-harvesting complex II chlorophyll a/b binding protein 5